MLRGRSNPFGNLDVFSAVKQAAAQAGQSSEQSTPQMPRAAENARLKATRDAYLRQRENARMNKIPDWAGGNRETQSRHDHGGEPGAYTSGMQALRDYVTKTWGITNVGGFADRNIAGTNKKSDHALHRAWDFMVGNDRAKGDAIANYIVNNYDKYGVKNLIWYDRSWNPNSGWKPYGHPGGGRSATLQHRDHPHVGFH